MIALLIENLWWALSKGGRQSERCFGEKRQMFGRAGYRFNQLIISNAVIW
jgi:hypothetical protein